MKINGTPNPEALKAYTNNSVGTVYPYRDPAAGTKPLLPSSDKVQISSTVKLFQDIQKAVQDLPDIRADKVKEIEEKIAQDTYKADYEIIADKLLSPIISSRI